MSTPKDPVYEHRKQEQRLGKALSGGAKKYAAHMGTAYLCNPIGYTFVNDVINRGMPL